MSSVEALKRHPLSRNGGRLQCCWKQSDDGTLTAAWTRAAGAGPDMISPSDPIARSVPGGSDRRNRSETRVARLTRIARAAMLSLLIVAIAAAIGASGVRLVEQSLAEPGEAVDVLAGA